MSRLAVAGAGYVGLTTATCLAELGHEVTVIDIDPRRVALLRRARVPFHEPGLPELVRRNLRAKRLRFTTRYDDAAGSEFAFIAVGTPPRPDGASDLTMVEAAARAFASAIAGSFVLVNKSTVPVGTADLLARVIAQECPHQISIVSNPEFLREGTAVCDFLSPDRVVIGADDAGAKDAVRGLYARLSCPFVCVSTRSAEMIKYASNAFLATRISFINEISRICERVDADVVAVAEAMGLDGRIGRDFLRAGVGYGGSCFPKDVSALRAMASAHAYRPLLLEAVEQVNRDQRLVAVDLLSDCLGSLRGKIVGLLGLAFKAGTDDIREAPSLHIGRELLRLGARVRAYDPAARKRAALELPGVDLCGSPYAMARGADALVVVTDWSQFGELDLHRLHRLMRGAVVIDGRNLYDPELMRSIGFVYRGIGRGKPASAAVQLDLVPIPQPRGTRTRIAIDSLLAAALLQ